MHLDNSLKTFQIFLKYVFTILKNNGMLQWNAIKSTYGRDDEFSNSSKKKSQS